MAISFYTQPPTHLGGIMVAPQWGYTKENFNARVLQPTLAYFRERAALLVNSQHILNRLLKSIQTPYHMPLDRFAELVGDDALHVAGALRMTTPLQKGMLFHGQFYSANDPEILLAHDGSFNAAKIHSQWKNVVAVRPLLHPKTDFSLTIPNGKDYGDEKGLSVILINVGMLAVQYRAFLIDAKKNETDNSMHCFLSRYVIPNMLQSTADLSLLNRLIAYENSTPVSTAECTQYSLMRPDLLYYIDNVIDYTLVSLTRVHNNFDALMMNMPSFMKDTQRHALMMPSMMSTRQVDWALMCARLKYFSFMIQLSQKQPGNPNMTQINQAYRSMRTWSALEMMEQQLTADVFEEMKGYCRTIFEAVGQKLD